ncbi:DUF2497 domain-containing protein [Roseomonas sp. HJA6]|uniref:DUF2497 domain-containing protein n=1 Tax=Roseomonas alba TaxID=2846776 RepID=A0ABS7ABW6_9PROT|nr:DUF2497 domain-containing protein [Neoroseomonas alba]MBW6399792.1 DUF2497 domain-containing protein [Neoroseomonas alba]
MEDILASIRRILNEDEAQPAAPASETPDATGTDPAPGAPEPLLLTEDMMVSPPEGPPATPEAAAELIPESESELDPEPAPQPDPEPAPSRAVSPESLLAPAVAAAAAASVGQLLRAVSTERSAAVHRGGPTIEDVVREELRPLLKDWLDQHLPGLVERLVRAEIERVVGRALS